MHKSQIAQFKVSNCIVQKQVQIKLKNPKVQLSAKNIKHTVTKISSWPKKICRENGICKQLHFHHFPMWPFQKVQKHKQYLMQDCTRERGRGEIEEQAQALGLRDRKKTYKTKDEHNG